MLFRDINIVSMLYIIRFKHMQVLVFFLYLYFVCKLVSTTVHHEKIQQIHIQKKKIIYFIRNKSVKRRKLPNGID